MFRRVYLALVTPSVTSAYFASENVSLTMPMGAESTTMMSYRSLSCSKKSCVRLVSNNSDGLGGMVPPTITSMPSTSGKDCTMSSSVVSACAKNAVTPGASASAVICASLGLRMSIPTSATLFPSMANAAARLRLTNDLPSPLTLDVTRTTLSSASVIMNCTLLRT